MESTKSVSDIYAPLTGTVVAANEELDSAPELINSAPYEAGWMIELQLADGGAAAFAGLLDAAAYGDLVGGLTTTCVRPPTG